MTELTDSVNDPNAAGLRESDPELFGGKPLAATIDDDADDAAEAAADSAADAEAAANVASDAAAAVPAKTNQRVPISRLNEVIAEREALREKLEAVARERIAAQAVADYQAANAKAAEPTTPARDFDAEIAALDDKLDSGEIDDTEHRKETRRLDREQHKHELAIATSDAKAAAIKEIEERTAKVQQQTAEQSFNAATARFFAAPENAPYATDKIRQAALNVAIADVFEEHGGSIADDAMLALARDRVEVSFGGAPAQGDETVQQKVARERRTAHAVEAAKASSMPGRLTGGMGERGNDSSKTVENVSRDEYRKMPQAERDKELGRT